MIRNRRNIFWNDGGIHTKNGGKTIAFPFPPFLEWIYSININKYYNDSLISVDFTSPFCTRLKKNSEA